MARWASRMVERACRAARFACKMFADYPFDENSHAPNRIAQSDVVTRFKSEDGTHALEIKRSLTGLYSYIEWVERFDEYDEQFYMSPGYQSGLYSCAGDAERDARCTISWLGDEPMRDAT